MSIRNLTNAYDYARMAVMAQLVTYPDTYDYARIAVMAQLVTYPDTWVLFLTENLGEVESLFTNSTAKHCQVKFSNG